MSSIPVSELSFPLRLGVRRWRIALINGPNMSNLVNRDPARFGPPQTIGQLEGWVTEIGAQLGLDVTSMHSNKDGEIIDWVQGHCYGKEVDGIVINPAGLTTYGDHVRHCLEETHLPCIEVHFANISVTGHQSVFTRTATGICHGFRKHSFSAALVAIAGVLDDETFPKRRSSSPTVV